MGAGNQQRAKSSAAASPNCPTRGARRFKRTEKLHRTEQRWALEHAMEERAVLSATEEAAP
eukprot:8820902-Pyramimonas_sp.AAC.1